jgi:translation initiation factor IF-3
VPIPRRFDRRPPERDQTRINERIRVPEVRLIGEDGNQVGVLSRDDALAYARQRDLDLVEVAAEARPPVCRVLDYSKYKYEQEQKAKQARKHQKQVTVREIKLRPKIATNDYETKKNHVERFLKHQDRVKITIMFRGRETTHPERGERLLMQLAEDVSEWGTIEQRPNLDGRNMTMLLAPVRQKEAAAGGDGDAPVGDEQAAPPPAAPAATAAEQAAAPEAAPPEAPEAAAPDAPEAEAPDAPEAEAPPAAAADDAASA